MVEILINAEACYGCRMCELACSFHHKEVFSPDASSIKVLTDNQNGEFSLSIDSSCDLCWGESVPQCVAYCVYGALKEVK